MKFVLAMTVLFIATGVLHKRVNRWTLAILLTGILGILFIRRITF